MDLGPWIRSRGLGGAGSMGPGIRDRGSVTGGSKAVDWAPFGLGIRGRGLGAI